MTIRDFTLIPVSVLLCATACGLIPGSGDDDDGGGTPSSGGETADDDASDSEDPSGDLDDTGVDSDPSGGDPSGDPTGDPSGDPTGVPGDALPDTVLVYLHDEQGSADSVRAYDVATDESWVVTDFGGATTVTSVAIHPDRTSLAISAFYQLSDPDESEGIWRMPAGGGEPELLMSAMPGDNGESQTVTHLGFAADGAYIYFDHSTDATGAGILGRVAAGGAALPELFFDASGTCTANAGPAPDPSGTQLLALHEGCADIAQQGLVLHDVPPSSIGEVAIPEGDSYDFTLLPPQWSADGSGVLFVIETQIDADGDGSSDGNGSAVMLWDIASAQIFEVVAPVDGLRIYSLAVSPDERYLALCTGSGGTKDLVIADLGGDAVSYRAITQDGASCDAAW